jgi:hypothetical protein
MEERMLFHPLPMRRVSGPIRAGQGGGAGPDETRSDERVHMKYMCAMLLIVAGAVCAAQERRNEIVILAVGNFNPSSYVYLHGPDGSLNLPMTSSSKSSLGWGAEYHRWLRPHFAIGGMFEQNPSDGKLLPAQETTLKYYMWPQMHYEMGVVATGQFAAGKKWSPFMRVGAGGNVTDGYDNCGWSHDFAFITGFGTEYALGKRTGMRAGMNILNTKSGCYGDHTCEQTWSAVQDVTLGMVYRW